VVNGGLSLKFPMDCLGTTKEIEFVYLNGLALLGKSSPETIDFFP